MNLNLEDMNESLEMAIRDKCYQSKTEYVRDLIRRDMDVEPETKPDTEIELGHLVQKKLNKEEYFVYVQQYATNPRSYGCRYSEKSRFEQNNGIFRFEKHYLEIAKPYFLTVEPEDMTPELNGLWLLENKDNYLAVEMLINEVLTDTQFDDHNYNYQLYFRNGAGEIFDRFLKQEKFGCNLKGVNPTSAGNNPEKEQTSGMFAALQYLYSDNFHEKYGLHFLKKPNIVGIDPWKIPE